MVKKVIIPLILAILLVACSTPENQPATVVQPTEASASADVEMEDPTEEAEMESEPVDTEEMDMEDSEADSTSGSMVYTIVPGESMITYTVDETFLDDNRLATAVGETTEINGEIMLDVENPQNSTIGTLTVDVSEFVSDSNRRDDAIRGRFLESSQYPIVTFVPSSIEGLPESYTEGETINFTVTGDTTIREVTMPITFDVEATLQNGELSGTGETIFLMSDFGFGPISILGVLNTEDEVLIQLNFVARP